MLRQLAPLVLIDLHVVMVSIGVLLTACSIVEYSSRHSADAKSSLESFQTYVHPEFVKMRCDGCHIRKDDDPPRLPEFADKDIAIAHAAAEQIVNFNDIESSTFVTKQKSTNGHNCNKTSGECDANAQKLITALTAWQASRDSSAEESYLFTKEINADNGKTGDYTNRVLRFAINELIDNIEGNVTLKVTASKSTRLKTLTLTNFKLSTTDKPIFLGGLIAKHNGIVSTDESKDRICALVKPDEDDDTILTQYHSMVITLVEGDSSPNMIALGLKNLRVATASDECDGKTINSVDETPITPQP